MARATRRDATVVSPNALKDFELDRRSEAVVLKGEIGGNLEGLPEKCRACWMIAMGRLERLKEILSLPNGRI